MPTTVYSQDFDGVSKTEAKQIAERLRQAATMFDHCQSGGQFYLTESVFIDILISDNTMEVSVIALP